MIKPEELRIGNYLTFEGEQSPILAIDGEREFTNTKTNETVKCAITIGQYDDDGFMWTTNGRWLKYFEYSNTAEKTNMFCIMVFIYK